MPELRPLAQTRANDRQSTGAGGGLPIVSPEHAARVTRSAEKASVVDAARVRMAIVKGSAVEHDKGQLFGKVHAPTAAACHGGSCGRRMSPAYWRGGARAPPLRGATEGAREVRVASRAVRRDTHRLSRATSLNNLDLLVVARLAARGCKGVPQHAGRLALPAWNAHGATAPQRGRVR